mmetsp:Transcript_4664/g.14100  ORF Transcript_4664/g.14100 Transcript_4664/m.14100 type:complete len:205 (+) Transcript_4664:874-1488(+)
MIVVAADRPRVDLARELHNGDGVGPLCDKVSEKHHLVSGLVVDQPHELLQLVYAAMYITYGDNSRPPIDLCRGVGALQQTPETSTILVLLSPHDGSLQHIRLLHPGSALLVKKEGLPSSLAQKPPGIGDLVPLPQRPRDARIRTIERLSRPRQYVTKVDVQISLGRVRRPSRRGQVVDLAHAACLDVEGVHCLLSLQGRCELHG